jgi:hypothetical protein
MEVLLVLLELLEGRTLELHLCPVLLLAWLLQEAA